MRSSPRCSGGSSVVTSAADELSVDCRPISHQIAGSSVVTTAADEVSTESASATSTDVDNSTAVSPAASEPIVFASSFADKVACMATGPLQHSIYRQVNSETGQAQTVVTDEHGRTRTFSQDTASAVLTGRVSRARVLSSSCSPRRASEKHETIVWDKQGRITAIGSESIVFDEALMRQWIGGLNTCHLKGFDQELRIRLSHLWTEYSRLKTEHEDHLENADYIFFGLGKDATLKELEKAYRKLAKRMHPDKNGGSDEAKSRFQDLKDRYEGLKKKMQSKIGQGFKKQEEQKELLDESQEYQDDTESEKSDHGSDDVGTEAAEPLDAELNRDAMEEKIWAVLDAARKMQRQMCAWKEQLESN